MKYIHLSICSTIVLLVVALACQAADDIVQLRPEVKERVTALLGQELSPPHVSYYGQHSKCNRYNSKKGVVFVDQSTGRIVMAVLNFDTAPAKKLSKDAIEDILGKWLNAEKININEWTQTENKCADRGDYIEYNYEWRKYTTAGVPLPSLLNVSISQSGDVWSWSYIDRPLEISTTPNIDSDTAVATALSNHKGYKAEGKPVLRVWYYGENQVLLWDIKLRSINGLERISATINAHTGKEINLSDKSNLR